MPIRINAAPENLFNQMPIEGIVLSLCENDPANKVRMANHNKPVKA